MKTYTLKNYWGEDIELVLARDNYVDNESLAVMSYTTEQEDFAVITVNIPFSEQMFGDYLKDNCAFVDTNNCPWAEQFLVENGLAQKVEGVIGRSGFCEYPLYKFNVDKIPTLEELEKEW